MFPQTCQDESRSISENSTWGIRRRFEQGKLQINHTKFLGYDKDEDGNLIINEKQAKIVRRIYKEFLNGKGANRIANDLEADGVPSWNGKIKWYESSIRKMLTNEKYKGDALLQKTYTVDFLSKKRLDNTGQVPQYYVEDSHPAIIDRDMWEAVQLEMERRKGLWCKNVRMWYNFYLEYKSRGKIMPQQQFKWKHFEPEIIIVCVRWYLKYPLSYRMLVEMMQERGLRLTHTTIMRWVHQYAPVIDEKIRKYVRPTNDSWRMDETYLKIKGKNAYLYRAVDSEGNTIDFFISEHRDKDAAKKFFKKALKGIHNQKPRVITTDKYAATEIAIHELIYSGTLSVETTIRKVKYLNNIIEQDHRFIKRKIKPMLGFQSFDTAEKTICGIEIMNMIRKGQVGEIQSVLSEVKFINKIMGIAA